MKKIILSIALLFALCIVGYASDNALWEKSTLNQILKRGELRVGLEAGYKPLK